MPETEAFGLSFAFKVVVLFRVLPVAPSAPEFGCQGFVRELGPAS